MPDATTKARSQAHHDALRSYLEKAEMEARDKISAAERQIDHLDRDRGIRPLTPAAQAERDAAQRVCETQQREIDRILNALNYANAFMKA